MEEVKSSFTLKTRKKKKKEGGGEGGLEIV